MNLPNPTECGFNPDTKKWESKEHQDKYHQKVIEYANHLKKNKKPTPKSKPIPIQDVLNNINEYYKGFRHNGKPLSKRQVKKVLQYGIDKGYTNIEQFTNEEVDIVLQK